MPWDDGHNKIACLIKGLTGQLGFGGGGRREESENKTYRSCCGLEHGHLAGGALELVGGHDGLEDLGGDVPQLLVLGAKEHNDTVRLGVEGGRNLVEELLDNLLDAGRGDGQVLGERVEGSARRSEVDEGLSIGSHFGGSGEASVVVVGTCGGRKKMMLMRRRLKTGTQ